MKASLLNFEKIFNQELNLFHYDFTEMYQHNVSEKYKTDNKYFEIVQVDDSATCDLLSFLYYGDVVEWDVIALTNDANPIFDLPKAQDVVETRVDKQLLKWEQQFLPIVSQNLTDAAIEEKKRKKREFIYSIVEKENEKFRNLKFIKKRYMIFMYEDIRKRMADFKFSEINEFKPVFIIGNAEDTGISVSIPIDSKNSHVEFDLKITQAGDVTSDYDISTLLSVSANNISLIPYVNTTLNVPNVITFTNLPYNFTSKKQFSTFESDIFKNIVFSITSQDITPINISVETVKGDTPLSIANKISSKISPNFSCEIFDENTVKTKTTSNVSTLPDGLINHCSCVLSDSRILICAGQTTQTQTSVINNTYIFNPFDGSTTQSISFPGVALSGAKITTLHDGRVLLTGGYNGSGVMVSTSYLGTIIGDTIQWVASTALPAITAFHNLITLSDGRVLLIYGTGLTATASTQAVYFGTISGNTITWVSSDVPSTECGHFYSSALEMQNGKILLLGGMYRTGSTSVWNTKLFVGSILANNITWEKGTDTFVAKNPVLLMLKNGKIISTLKKEDDTSALFEFELLENTLIQTQENLLNYPLSTGVLTNELVYLIGGAATFGAATFLNTIDAFEYKDVVKLKILASTDGTQFLVSNTYNFLDCEKFYDFTFTPGASIYSLEFNDYDVIITKNTSGNIAEVITYFSAAFAVRMLTYTVTGNTIRVFTPYTVTNIENIIISKQIFQPMISRTCDVEYNYIPKYQIIDVELISITTDEETFRIFLNNKEYIYVKPADTEEISTGFADVITDISFEKNITTTLSFSLIGKSISKRSLVTSSSNVNIVERFN